VKTKRTTAAAPTAPAVSTTPAVPTTPRLNDAVAQTVADAQAVGRELGAAGLTLARGTARLAYDVGSVLAEAGRSLVGGTIRAAEGLARREDATGERRATAPQRDGNTGSSGAEAAAPLRKSLARAGTAPARRRRLRA
jgi:hypothetical protein